MKPDVFEQLDEHFMKQVSHVLHEKGKHYTEGEDRFSAFHAMAELNGTDHLAEALSGMSKHVVAFFAMFRRHHKEGGSVPFTKFMEHGGDIINYVRLINGMLAEGTGDDYIGCNLPDCDCQIPGELCVKRSS